MRRKLHDKVHFWRLPLTYMDGVDSSHMVLAAARMQGQLVCIAIGNELRTVVRVEGEGLHNESLLSRTASATDVQMCACSLLHELKQLTSDIV